MASRSAVAEGFGFARGVFAAGPEAAAEAVFLRRGTMRTCRCGTLWLTRLLMAISIDAVS